MACREQWTALGEPVQAMAFDFHDAEDNMQPLQVSLTVPAPH